jgi:phosphoenolpyruvate---glycerone phosphotransferase subunit DhaM
MSYVGIVLVSHSATLAAGVRELLAQVAGPDVRVEPAGGADDGSLGTSAERIEAAITAAG